MCGISGIVSFKRENIQEEQLRLMMKTMKHRGPDDEGTFIKDHIGFGFVRLSILDLSTLGHQPMQDPTGRYTIMYNGEVFNYIELREELKAKGHSFISGTDTEVLLHAYIEYGEKFLHKLNGMWAFAIYDAEKKTVFCARDRYGIKPFYYTANNDGMLFASEIKSILAIKKDRSVNEKNIYEYIVYNRTDQSNDTFFNDIHKLPHGHYMTITEDNYKIERWYSLNDRIREVNPITPEAYYDLFSSSVELRLRSDVPLGVSLSGGLDSSSVVSVLLERFKLNELNTFSAIYKGETNDESSFIEEYESKLNNMHYTSPSADTFWSDYKEFIAAHNEPVNDVGSYAQYKVMELATKHVTVTLDGQGADEQLGGYHNFFGAYYKELFTTLKWLRFIKENMAYLLKHKSGEAFKFFIYFMLPLQTKKKVSTKVYGCVNPQLFDKFRNTSTIQENLYNPKNLNESLIQHFEYKLEHLLKWEDLNSMHFSIESRVPFLDYRFVETTLSLPSNQIIKNGMTKYILRESMKEILPPSICYRKDKKGFANPREKWFRDPRFKELIMDIITSSEFHNLGYFDPKDCMKRYEMHLDDKANYSKDIWKWINIFEWYNTYIK